MNKKRCQNFNASLNRINNNNLTAKLAINKFSHWVLNLKFENEYNIHFKTYL